MPGVRADPVGGQPADVSHEDTEAVFRSLYAEHGPPLLRLASTLTGGDRGRAEDLVQETMLRPGPTATTWTSGTAPRSPG